MSEVETKTTAEQETEGTVETTKPVVDLAKEVDKWKALARKNETRAKENADKAQRLDALEEESKTETQKLMERAEAAEKLAAEKEAQLARLAAARQHKLSDADMTILEAVPADQVGTIAEALAARSSNNGAGTLAERLGNLGDPIPHETSENPTANDLIRAAAKR